jgi:MFS family permease
MKNNRQERLWSPNFCILWQGQVVSSLGDAVYSVALGFWVLKVTGSTVLMGTLMAASTLPGILVSPFAGVLIDRYSKKHLMILMDIIRGLSIVILAISAFKRLIAIWMVFVAGILLSVCGAVFAPGVNSSIPDLVPKSKLTNANSIFLAGGTGANMFGSIAGGFLFQSFGVPLLFLFNGLSFLVSGISVLFINIPMSKENIKRHFINDMGDGFNFMWKIRGLRYILILVAVINFFSSIAIVLFLPLFQRTPSLGAGKYGVAMACFMGGAMAGFLFSSIISIQPRIVFVK